MRTIQSKAVILFFSFSTTVTCSIVLISCSNDSLAPAFDESLPNVSGPINIQSFDSYCGDSLLYLYWTTGMPFIDFPYEPQPPKVDKVRIFLSEAGPSSGFKTIETTDDDGQDSTIIRGLRSEKIYYLRLAVYDTSGKAFGLSRPLMTMPGHSNPPIVSYPMPQVESPLYLTNISWAPDNERLAVIGAEDSYSPNIYIFDTRTGAISQLTSLPATNYRLLAVSWSPDSQWISYCYTPSSTAGEIDYRIWLISPEHVASRALTSGRVDFDPAWDHNGNIYFCKGTYDPPNIPELYKINVQQPDSEYRITNDQHVRKYNPTVSPDDDFIVYSGEKVNTSQRYLYAISLHNGVQTPLTENQYWSDIQPSWSSDSKIIVFSSDRSGHFELWALNLQTMRFTQITRGLRHGVQRFHGSWSPNRVHLAYLETETIHRSTLIIQ